MLLLQRWVAAGGVSIVRGDNAERNGTHLLAEVLRKRDEDDTRELGDLDPDTGSGPGCRR